MQDMTEDGPGSKGCDDLESEIGSAKNQVRTWKAELEATNNWQMRSLLRTKIDRGLRWIKAASIIYDSNCTWADMGFGPGPAS